MAALLAKKYQDKCCVNDACQGLNPQGKAMYLLQKAYEKGTDGQGGQTAPAVCQGATDNGCETYNKCYLRGQRTGAKEEIVELGKPESRQLYEKLILAGTLRSDFNNYCGRQGTAQFDNHKQRADAAFTAAQTCSPTKWANIQRKKKEASDKQSMRNMAFNSAVGNRAARRLQKALKKTTMSKNNIKKKEEEALAAAQQKARQALDSLGLFAGRNAMRRQSSNSDSNSGGETMTMNQVLKYANKPKMDDYTLQWIGTSENMYKKGFGIDTEGNDNILIEIILMAAFKNKKNGAHLKLYAHKNLFEGGDIRASIQSWLEMGATNVINHVNRLNAKARKSFLEKNPILKHWFSAKGDHDPKTLVDYLLRQDNLSDNIKYLLVAWAEGPIETTYNIVVTDLVHFILNHQNILNIVIDVVVGNRENLQEQLSNIKDQYRQRFALTDDEDNGMVNGLFEVIQKVNPTSYSSGSGGSDGSGKQRATGGSGGGASHGGKRKTRKRKTRKRRKNKKRKKTKKSYKKKRKQTKKRIR